MKPSKVKSTTTVANPASPVRMTSAITNLNPLDQTQSPKKPLASKEAADRKRPSPKESPPDGRPAPQALTCIEAKIDVGFGNNLFIRGCGPGLSWEKGVLLDCRDGSTWLWTTSAKTDLVEFKLLLNDQVWARGDNLVVGPGQQMQVVPSF